MQKPGVIQVISWLAPGQPAKTEKKLRVIRKFSWFDAELSAQTRQKQGAVGIISQLDLKILDQMTEKLEVSNIAGNDKHPLSAERSPSEISLQQNLQERFVLPAASVGPETETRPIASVAYDFFI